MASLREELIKHTQIYNEYIELVEKVASAADSGKFTDEENKLITFARKNAMSASRAYMRIIASIKEQKNDDHVSLIRDFPTVIDPGCSIYNYVMLKLYDSRRIPFATSPLDKLRLLNKKTFYCSQLAKFKTGPERQEAIENALSTFKAAQDIVNAELTPSHPNRLELALALSDFYYEILHSPDGACSIAQQAVDEAMAEFAACRKAKGELVVATESKVLNKLGTPEERYNYSVTVAMMFLRSKIEKWTSIMQGKAVTSEGKKKKSRTMSKKKEEDGVESSVTMTSPRQEELVKQAECYKEIVELMEKVATTADSTEGNKKISRTMDGAESSVIRTASP